MAIFEKTPLLLRPPGGAVPYTSVAEEAANLSSEGKHAAKGGSKGSGSSKSSQSSSPKSSKLEGGPAKGSSNFWRTLAAGSAYTTASISMVITNKIALSGFKLSSPTFLLFYQCLLCVLLVGVCMALGFAKPQRLNWAVVKAWVPVNLVFVSMVWTSFAALQFLSIPTVTVLKNLANLFTIVGDYALNGRTYSAGIWSTLVLMAVSAVASGLTDLEFSLAGYVWQIINCMFTAANSLYLRRIMDTVKQHTEHGTPLSEMSMVLLNNALSLPVLLALLASRGELYTVAVAPELRDPSFMMAATISGLVSFGISFGSLWFLSTTTPTTYSLVGSLNKVPIALLSMWLFPGPNSTNPQNLASVCIGLMAGVVFVYTKTLEVNKNGGRGGTNGGPSPGSKQQQP